MSLILDALNRARDNVDPVPTLSTHHPVEPLPRGGTQYLPWMALALALALIAWLVWDRFSTPPPPPPERVDSPVAELTRNIGSAATAVTTELKARAEERQEVARAAAPQPPAAEPAVASLGQVGEAEAGAVRTGESAAPPPIPVAAEADPVAEVREPAVSATPPGDSGVPTAPAESARAPAAADAAVANLYRDRSVPEEPAERAAATGAREEPVDIEGVLRQAQDEMQNAKLDEHPVPFLSDLSQQFKNEVPTIYYRQHDYSNEAGKSSVTLNGETVRTGGSAGSGLTVEEILPDSVVLNYRGTRFRLRALNSWVNL